MSEKIRLCGDKTQSTGFVWEAGGEGRKSSAVNHIVVTMAGSELGMTFSLETIKEVLVLVPVGVLEIREGTRFANVLRSDTWHHAGRPGTADQSQVSHCYTWSTLDALTPSLTCSPVMSDGSGSVSTTTRSTDAIVHARSTRSNAHFGKRRASA